MAYWTFAFLRKRLKYENLMDADDSYNTLTAIKGNTEKQWYHVIHMIVWYAWITPLLICEYLNLQKTTQKVFFTKLATKGFKKIVYSVINYISILRYKSGYFLYNAFSVDFAI